MSWPTLECQDGQYFSSDQVLTATVRRLVKSSETAGSRQRLYPGRPRQKVAVDLVGPLTTTPQGDKRILVLTDRFTRWQDVLTLSEAKVPVVHSVLDKSVFCYIGLHEQIRMSQGAQFEKQLMTKLCQLCFVEKSHHTPYCSHANEVVERNNLHLGDSLTRVLQLTRGQKE